MKKALLTLTVLMAFGFCASAQNDNFFKNSRDDNGGNRGAIDDLTTPALPGGGVGYTTTDQGAPLGSGVLVLTALGAGYAITRRRQS